MSTEEILAMYKEHGLDDGSSASPAEELATASGQSTASAQGSPRAPKSESTVVWKLHPDKSMEPVKVSLGITDHAFTQVTAVLKGELKEGDDVVIRSAVAKEQLPGAIRR
jgi:hypothetical protein